MKGITGHIEAYKRFIDGIKECVDITEIVYMGKRRSLTICWKMFSSAGSISSTIIALLVFFPDDFEEVDVLLSIISNSI